MKRIKKSVAILLLSLTLFNSIFVSYSITAQATDVGLTLTTLDAMLSLFGVSIGLGNQVDRLSNNEIMGDVMDAASTGGTVTMSNYGTVDFSDSDSVNSWLTWCADHNDYTLGRYEGNNVWDNTVDKVARTLDSVSYAASGLCATNEMNNSITNLVSNLSSDSGYTVEDIHDACTVVSGADNGTLSWDKWNIFSAIASAVVLSNADKMVDIVDAFKVPDETVYTELAFSSDDAVGFTGNYPIYSRSIDPDYDDGNYRTICIHFSTVTTQSDYYYILNVNNISNLFGLKKNNTVYFYTYNSNNTLTNVYTIGRCKSTSGSWLRADSVPSVDSDYLDCLYLPLFSSGSDAGLYFNNGDTSGILNLVDGIAYPDFKTKVQARPTSFDRALEGLIDADPSINKFKDKIPAILDVADTAVGTPEAVSAIEDAITDTAGTGESDDTSSGSTAVNYSGILGKILSAILALPKEIFDIFTDPIGVITAGWEQLLAWISVIEALIANGFADVIDAINPIPPISDDGEDGSSGNGGTVNLLNGILLLVYILFKLLQIFLHLLEFIINIFKIPATPGFITGDFAIGFEFIKTVQLSPLSISVYDFLMGLIHILVIFSVVKVLKKHIDKMHI